MAVATSVQLSTATQISPQADIRSPRGRPWEVPVYGHQVSPGTATGTPPRAATIPVAPRRAAPPFPARAWARRAYSPSVTIRMGTVQELVDESRGDGLVHQLVEA